MRAPILLVLLSLLPVFPLAAAPEPYRVLPVEMTVPVPPAPVRAGGKARLVYELHVTNLDPRAREYTLTALDVLGVSADGHESPLLHLAGGDLAAALSRPGAPENLADKTKIGAGLRAVAFLWIDLEGPAPATLRHRLTFHFESGDKSVDGGEVAVRTASPVVLGPPLRGGRWVAANAPSNTSDHRRAMIIVDGRPRIAQRFAIDWVQLGEDGLPYHGDAKKNESWVCYGQDLLAVADGTVASTKDGLPLNTPLESERTVPVTLDTIAGNFVVLDLGNGLYALYAHVLPGSLRVKTGDRVHRGQVLGLLGNTGNSDAPHLHFHVMDANQPIASEGLPYVFADYWLQGKAASPDDILAGKPWKPAGPEEHRTGEIPLENDVVRFP
ncbi:MAG TPA: M23 family metallopeptidase [Thermoanaerobaculia bacterium]|jgi:hypothetical protein|nr:M23 family metallopeptidase [Thermoanaerobaculia bacterium]